MNNQLIGQLDQMQSFFKSYHTYDHSFRKQQLLKLKNAILSNEKIIHEALYADLKKKRGRKLGH